MEIGRSHDREEIAVWTYMQNEWQSKDQTVGFWK